VPPTRASTSPGLVALLSQIALAVVAAEQAKEERHSSAQVQRPISFLMERLYPSQGII